MTIIFLKKKNQKTICIEKTKKNKLIIKLIKIVSCHTLISNLAEIEKFF